MSCAKGCKHGPGYASPMAAVRKGPREKLLYVVTVQPNKTEPHGDYLATVDVDPESETYCQVVYRTYTNSTEDELHHSGWNTCSSCHEIDDKTENIPTRDKLILPSINTGTVYIFDVGTNQLKPEIFKKISGDVLRKHNVTAPHTTHCLANGNIMISTMGDCEGNAKGDFILFNSNFDCIGTWTKGDKKPVCGYDFWYQPFFDVMVASEWGAPKLFNRGYHPSDLDNPNEYGRSLNFYKWSEQKLVQTINLGSEGLVPLEIRFLHDPKEPQGYVGCCLSSNIYRFYKKDDADFEFAAEKVIQVPFIKVEGWTLPEMPAMVTDILLSLDDRFLYFSCWLHGDVRQYDITDRKNPKLTGQIYLGGLLVSNPEIKVLNGIEYNRTPKVIKGTKLEGGPQMLQLSLDGKRLYVSSSLYSPWDKQFYPGMVKAGGYIAKFDIDTENGGMKLDENFLVDFGKEPYGPSLPHEMRYPGGDCTSDIWLAKN